METNFTFRESDHSYWLDGQKMTGVTTVLGVVAKPALIGWAANEAARYIEGETMIAFGDGQEFSPETFKEICDNGRKAHTQIKDKAGDSGKKAHSLIEEYIKEAINDKRGYLSLEQIDNEQINQFIKWAVDNEVRFLESEKVMYHPEWFVGGTADFVCEIDGKKYVGDLKTGKGVYYEAFAQCAAYRAMLEHMGEKEFHGSIVVHVPQQGKLQTHERYDYETDLKFFEAALTIYRIQNSGLGTTSSKKSITI